MTQQIEGAQEFRRMQTNMHRSTVCGSGSTLPNTRAVRKWLREVIETHDIDSILDAPCGDHRWMADVVFHGTYLGLDCDDIAILRAQDRRPYRNFKYADLCSVTALRWWGVRFDLLICRDFLVHLPFDTAQQALYGISKCGKSLVALTHFPDVKENTALVETHPGWGWRPLNMTLAPFNLPEPIDICYEDEGQGKTMGLFRL